MGLSDHIAIDLEAERQIENAKTEYVRQRLRVLAQDENDDEEYIQQLLNTEAFIYGGEQRRKPRSLIQSMAMSAKAPLDEDSEDYRRIKAEIFDES